MAAESPTTQEIFKRVYVDPVEKVIPQSSVFRRKVAFDQRNRTGAEYRTALQLRWPQGWTFNGGATLNTDYTLNAGVAGLVKQAAVTPSEFTIRQTLPYGMIASSDGVEQAFNETVALNVAAVVEVTDAMLELQTLYGGTYIGATNTSTGSTPNFVGQVSLATWAPGIWTMLEGAFLDAYSDSALTTKLNATGTCTLTGVAFNTRTLTIACSVAGEYTAIAAAGTVYWVPRGVVSNWVSGVDSLITTSAAGGSVFGITAANYSLMQANTYATSGQMTFSKSANAVINAAMKGGMGDQSVVVSAYAWTDMMNDQASLRQYVGNYGGEFENGADELVYHGPNGGRLSFVMSPMVMAGSAYILNFADWKRIGSSEPTFNIPGRGSLSNPFMLQDSADKNSLEFRRYYEQGVYCSRLARQTKITGIVNASGPSGGGS